MTRSFSIRSRCTLNKDWHSLFYTCLCWCNIIIILLNFSTGADNINNNNANELNIPPPAPLTTTAATLQPIWTFCGLQTQWNATQYHNNSRHRTQPVPPPPCLRDDDMTTTTVERVYIILWGADGKRASLRSVFYNSVAAAAAATADGLPATGYYEYTLTPPYSHSCPPLVPQQPTMTTPSHSSLGLRLNIVQMTNHSPRRRHDG